MKHPYINQYNSIEEFEILPKLGENAAGSYGVVVNAIRKSDRKEFVMKFFGYTKNKPDISWILREIDNLSSLSGISGVSHLEATFNDDAEGLISHIIPKIYKRRYPIIVLEKLCGGDLFEKILEKADANQSFSERDASTIFNVFVKTLDKIHNERNLINIDLKTENLMFLDSRNESVKIIDFGMAVPLWNRLEHFEDSIVGTAAFLAPETILGYEFQGQAVYSRSTDIWQAGCILYTLLTAQYPFGTNDDRHLNNRIVNGNMLSPIAKLSVSLEAKDLLSRMFEADPNKRIQCADILQHPWLVNNTVLPESAFGDEYLSRIKNWSARRRFRRLLDRNSLLSLQNQVTLPESPTSGAGKSARSFEEMSLCTNSVGHARVPFARCVSDCSDFTSSSDELSQKRLRRAPHDAEQVLVTGAHASNTGCSDAVTDDCNYISSNGSVKSVATTQRIVVTEQGISLLKQAYLANLNSKRHLNSVSYLTQINGDVNYENYKAVIFSASLTMPSSFNTEDYTLRTAFTHEGVDYDSFCNIVTAAGYPQLATRNEFAAFDWNSTDTVSYLEFLVTLCSFRSDVCWVDSQSVAKAYFNVFDLAGVGYLESATLGLVLAKLDASLPAIGQSPHKHSNTQRSQLDIEMAKMAPKSGTVSMGDEIAGLLQLMDPKGEGRIYYAEFEKFFSVLCQMKTLSAAVAPPQEMREVL